MAGLHTEQHKATVPEHAGGSMFAAVRRSIVRKVFDCDLEFIYSNGIGHTARSVASVRLAPRA